MSSDWSRELSAAIAAVRRASKVTRAVQESLVTEDTLQKRDKSPVTVADFASQAVVCAALAVDWDDTPVVGEENADELRQPVQSALRDNVVHHAATVLGAADERFVLDAIDRGGFDPLKQPEVKRYWTLDPIDGTKGFLRKEQYAVALALIEEGRVVLGVLGCPNLDGPGGTGLLLAATRGGGTRMLPLHEDCAEGGSVHVTDVADPSHASFCESVESGHSDQDQSARIAAALGITKPAVRMDSQAKYAALARGDASIYLRLPTRADYQEKIWDHAAGAIVVEEAGGKVTDTAGRPLDFSVGRTLSRNTGVVATNGKIHDRVIAAVRDVLNG